MNARVDHLLHEALELPDDERSALVVALLDSLEGSADPSISEAWQVRLSLCSRSRTSGVDRGAGRNADQARRLARSTSQLSGRPLAGRPT